MEQARVAVCHAFALLKKESEPLLPTGIFTIPEASMVGETEQAVRESGVDYVVGRAPYGQNPRGRLIGDDGMNADESQVVAAKNEFQEAVLGEQATEVVHIGMLAMLCQADAELFNRACFNYPTLGDLYKYATYDAMLQRLGG